MILAMHQRKDAIDADIFVGMVTAIEIFVKHTVSKMRSNEVAEDIGHKGKSGKSLNLVAVTTGRENEYLISDFAFSKQTIQGGERIVGVEEMPQFLSQAESMREPLKQLVEFLERMEKEELIEKIELKRLR